MSKQFINEMKQVKYDPILSNSYIVLIEGIDYFLISSFQEQNEKPSILKKIFGRKGKMVIELNYSIAPSMMQQIEEWAYPQKFSEYFKKRKMEFHSLDKNGNSISKTEYTGLSIANIEYAKYEYNKNEIAKIKIELSYKNKIVHY